MRHRGDPVLGQGLGGVAVATVGAYSTSSSEEAQNSDSGHSTTTQALGIHASTTCLMVWLPIREGG